MNGRSNPISTPSTPPQRPMEASVWSVRPRDFVAALLALGVSTATGALLAAGAAPADAEIVAPPGVSVSLIRVVGALAFVSALFFGGVWLSRHARRLIEARNSTAKLRILEARPLGPRQTLYVVAYQDRRWLIGASMSGISVLSPLHEDSGVDASLISPSSFGFVVPDATNRDR